MSQKQPTYPTPHNEPVREYRPGSAETQSVQKKLAALAGQEIEIPLIIDGKEVRTGTTGTSVVPHDHKHVLARFHKAGPREVQAAIEGSQKAWKSWSRTAPEARAAVFLKAAELLAGPWRDTLNASTMLGQSKTVYQAEIDAACELIDFWRFNAAFQDQMYRIQPNSPPGVWNGMEYRALEGFVFAVTPFNFTSIGGNLPTAPALLGNVALWKPASTSVYSNYFVMKLLEEAGLPPGVIQFIPGDGATMGPVVLDSESLAGIHFTGGTDTFHTLWRGVGERIDKYKGYPRLVGETGGKDFVFAHPSADRAALRTALVRGAFEYQGQKCSAASRAYLPKSIWQSSFKDELIADVQSLRMGDVADFKNFLGAVIDKSAFQRLSGAIARANESSDAKIVVGGKSNNEKGWFVEPTIVETTDPKSFLMTEEFFGPLLSVYIYDDAKWEETLALCDRTSPYALTGAFFSQDRAAIVTAHAALENAAGNFYVNNKPTGAVVGQQPFGGGRASGTNDKAGSIFNLLRWVSVRTVSETMVPPRDYRYPFLGTESPR